MAFIYDRKKTAVIFKDKKYSYAEIIKMAKIYSSLLNIEKEDRVAILMENRAEYVGVVLGIFDKKGTCTSLDASYDVNQIKYVLIDSTPKYIFVSNQTLEVVTKAIEETDSTTTILNVDEIDVTKDFIVENYSIEPLDKESVAVMLYTSGTTGNPKGVMLTYDNLLSNIEGIEIIKLAVADDIVLSMLPFHHVLPLVLTMIVPLAIGATIVILDELSSEAIKRNLKEHKVTVVIGVPRIWEMFHKGIIGKIKSSAVSRNLFNLCKKINNKTLNKVIFKKVQEGLGGHIRVLVSGGAKLDQEICEDFATFGMEVTEGYGLTETSPMIAFNRPGDIIPGTVGVPIPGIEVILAEDGEILVKGRNVMKGYFNKPEATAEVIDKDGWFHTGDLAQFDGNHIRIIGRKKEMIVLSNGKNINPADIEAEIMKETSLIEEVAIVEDNNHLVALVYPKFKEMEEKKIVNIKETIKWEVIDKYNVNAPNYRKILEIIIVKEELPKTKLGKLRRFMLKDLINRSDFSSKDLKTVKKQEKKVSNSKEINSLEFKAVSKFIKTLHDDVDIIPESHLEIDLGLDSLDMVEIISFVEHTFGVVITEEDFSKIKTVEDLSIAIRKKGGNFEDKKVNWKNILSEPIDIKMPSSTYVGFTRMLLKPIFSLYIKLQKNSNKLKDKSPVIFVGNHQSMLDAFAFGQTLPTNILKNCYFLATKNHFKGSLKEYFAKNSNIVLIDLNKNLKETLKISANILKNGKNLVIFPEGARTRDGEIQDFKKTFAILSKELDIPVVPFVIKGAYDLMPYGTNFPKSGNMSVTILDEISPKDKSVETIISETVKSITDVLNKN